MQAARATIPNRNLAVIPVTETNNLPNPAAGAL